LYRFTIPQGYFDISSKIVMAGLLRQFSSEPGCENETYGGTT
jgi:hypothetical protein